MPCLRVMLLDGQPMHAPCRRIRATPSAVISTSSRSPPSDCTLGRMSSRMRVTFSFVAWEVGAAIQGKCKHTGGYVSCQQ